MFNNTNGYDKLVTIPKTKPLCDACLQAKMHNKPYKNSTSRATSKLELIHADLMELPVESHYRQKYALLMLDDYSSYATCALL